MISEITDTRYYTNLLEIWESSVKTTHDFLMIEDFEFYKSQIPSFFPMLNLYLYKDEDHIVPIGFMGIKDNKIEMLFVSDSFQGKGVGTALLKYALEKLYVTHVDVNEQNVNARKFYEKFGFVGYSYSETDSFGRPYPILYMKLV